MLTLKHYLQNLHFQSNLLISFFLENESLLSPELVSILDQSQLELKDLLEIKAEIGNKLSLIDNIEIVATNPRYFTSDRPSELIQFYSSQPDFNSLSPALNAFLAYANPFAQAMHKSNLGLIEKLPPLYQSILNHSRKNRREGFRDTLTKIVYENQYPTALIDEYIRITTLVADAAKTKVSLNYIFTTLEQRI